MVGVLVFRRGKQNVSGSSCRERMRLGSYIWFRAKIAAGLPFEGAMCWGVWMGVLVL